MKKLSITLLALALALVMSVPAMAIHIDDPDSPEGSLGISGRYQFDGQIDDVDGDKKDAFDDDLDLSITMIKGDVKAFVGLEIADTGTFEGSSHAGKSPITDNYYVEWSAMDNLKVKIGEYGISFGRAIGTDGAGARNIQATYSMDALVITGALIKESSGLGLAADGIAAVAASPSAGEAAVAYAGTITVDSADDDNDTLMLKLSLKEAGPFTKVDLVSYTQMNDVKVSQANSVGPDTDLSPGEISYTGVDLALPIGPVDVGFEYGANGGDNDGTFMIVELGLEELIGFDLGVNYFISSDDYLAPFDGNDFAPGMIMGDQVNGDLTDLSIIWLTAGYSVNDNLSLNGAVILAGENDAGAEYGTEIDVGLKYKIADNISYQLKYGTYSAGDIGGDDDVDRTETFHRLEFKF